MLRAFLFLSSTYRSFSISSHCCLRSAIHALSLVFQWLVSNPSQYSIAPSVSCFVGPQCGSRLRWMIASALRFALDKLSGVDFQRPAA